MSENLGHEYPELAPGFTAVDLRSSLSYLSSAVTASDILPASAEIGRKYHRDLSLSHSNPLATPADMLDDANNFTNDTARVGSSLLGSISYNGQPESALVADKKIVRILDQNDVRHLFNGSDALGGGTIAEFHFLTGFLLTTVSSQIGRQLLREGVDRENLLSYAAKMDEKLQEVCAAIVSGKHYKSPDPILKAAAAKLREAYELPKRQSIAANTVSALAPYLIIDKPVADLSDADILAAVDEIIDQCRQFDAELGIEVTSKNRNSIIASVRQKHKWARENGRPHMSVNRAYCDLILGKVARSLIPAIASGELRLNTTLTIADTRDGNLREQALTDLALVEARILEAQWVQVGPSIGTGSPTQREQIESDAPEDLPPNIDIERLNWLKELRDTWPVPGAVIVRRPLTKRESRKAQEEGVAPERAYRGYYVVLLPEVLASGEVVYNAVGDSLVKGRHAVLAFKWQTGANANGEVIAKPEHVFAKNKDWAKLMGAKRILHTSTMRQRTLDYLRSSPELADPPEERLAAVMAYLAINS